MHTMEMWRLLLLIGLASWVNAWDSNQSFDRHGSETDIVPGIIIAETLVHNDKQHLGITTQTSERIPLQSSANKMESRQSLRGAVDRQRKEKENLNEGVKIHNNVLYEINKSNQEHSESHNRLTSAVEGLHLVDDNGNVDDVDDDGDDDVVVDADSSSPSTYFKRVEEQESRTPAEHKDKLLLHRHKRYLLFPEGSSFQLVFDLIIPIVDYTNFAIMGITCAVAWELPSKPPSEIIENFRHKLNDGTYGISRRNDSALQRLEYTDAPERVAGNWQPHSQLSSLVSASESGLQQTPPPRNAYYSNMLYQPQISSSPQKETPYEAASKDWSMNRNSNKLPATKDFAPWQRDKWWTDNKNRIQNQWQQNQWKWQTASHPNDVRNGRNRKLLTKHPKHRIYPVFGKRKRRSSHLPSQYNDDDTHSDGRGFAHKLNEIHMKQHVDSRHTLYGKIEKLYKTRGHNGTACVLRTLCETQKLQRQRRRQPQNPDTFVMELLRVIFNLPSDALAIKSIDTPYAAAVLRAHEIKSCSRHYNGCEHPIWNNVEI